MKAGECNDESISLELGENVNCLGILKKSRVSAREAKFKLRKSLSDITLWAHAVQTGQMVTEPVLTRLSQRMESSFAVGNLF